MAMLKVLNKKGKYHDLDAREDLVRYIFNPLKTQSGFRGGIIVGQDIIGSMNDVAIKFNKVNGVQLRHFILSFTPDELDDPEKANEIACQIIQFIGQEYQTIFAVHENAENLHIHFMFNSVSYRDGHRYRGTKKEYYDLVNFVNGFLKQYYGLYLITASSLSDVDIQKGC